MDSIVELEHELTRPPWGAAGRALTLGLVSGFAKVMLTMVNSMTVENKDTLLKHVMERPPGVGLVTVSNHTSLFDDPGLVSAMVPWWYFWADPRHEGMRWTMCAREVCFKNELFRQFFMNGKTLPIERGGGVDQPVMSVAARLVSQGQWLHVFPEGRIVFTGKLGTFKWGVGKIVCESRIATGRDPVVLPFYHSGMSRVLPLGKFFQAGEDIAVKIGEPMDLSDLTCKCGAPGVDQAQVWRQITDRMHIALAALETQLPPNPDQSAEAARRNEKQRRHRRDGGGEPAPPQKEPQPA